MKQILVFCIAMLLVDNIAKSQCTTPVNNANNGTGNYLAKFNAAACIQNSILFDNATNVGIGYGGAGSYKLDVNGDFNAGGSSTTTTNCFRFGTSRILWHNGSSTNMFVGVGAAAVITSGTQNTFLGYRAGYSNTTGSSNVFIGHLAGNNNISGANNILIGNYAGALNLVSGSIFIGDNAVYANANGLSNIYIGLQAGLNNNDGSYNTVLGYTAGRGVSTYANNKNCFFGYSAGYGVSTGYENVFMGYQSGLGLTTGANNSVLGSQAGKAITTGGNNTFLGWGSGIATTTGGNNLFIGHAAGYTANTTSSSSFIGFESGYSNTTGTENHFIGYQSGRTNTTGSANTFNGFQAGYNNISGINNYFSGYKAGAANTDGVDNVFAGYKAGNANTQGSYNVFVGVESGKNNTTGGGSPGAYWPNVFIGHSSGYNNTSTGDNVAIGAKALFLQSYPGASTYNVAVGNGALYANQPISGSTGMANTALGYSAGDVNTTGTGNTYLGYNADGCATCSTITNATAIGYNAVVGASNSKVLGGTGTYSVNVGIGTTTPTNGHLEVQGPVPGTQVYALSTATSGTNTGLEGRATGSGASYNAGGFFYASGGTNNYSIQIYSPSAASNTYAIYSNAPAKSYFAGNIGIGTTTPQGALDVAGSAYCTANAWTTSDSTKKKNIRDLNLDALSIIKELRPVTFEWKKEIDNGMKGIQMGFIAQELELLLPTMVGSRLDSATTKAMSNAIPAGAIAKNDTMIESKVVKYDDLFPVLVRGMQQQQNLIDSLMTIVNALQGEGQRNIGNSNDEEHKETTNQIDLANNSQPILYQNEPNPFDGSTVIRYFIPENITGSAFVVFYDMYGKEVNKLEIREKGFGKIEANTENLASGIYSYSILVDGKAIDTKKMLKSK